MFCLPGILHFDIHKVWYLPTKSTFRGSPSVAPTTKYIFRGSPNIAAATKSANEPHVQKPRFIAPIMKSEFLDDYHQCAAKLAFRRKIIQMPCA